MAEKGESQVMGEPTSGSGACYSSRLHAHVAHVLLASAVLALPPARIGRHAELCLERQPAADLARGRKRRFRTVRGAG